MAEYDDAAGLFTTEVRTARLPAADYLRDYVDVPKFLECCRACPNYGKRWSCPPFDFDVETRWRRYRSLEVMGVKVFPADGEGRRLAGKDPAAFLAPLKARLGGELAAREAATPGSLWLAAGSCRLCEVCAEESGKPCRFPDKMRPSLEALGGDVVRTARDLLGIELLWGQNGQAPEYFTLVCGFLTGGTRPGA